MRLPAARRTTHRTAQDLRSWTWPAVLALAVVFPALLGRGYVLVADMVFVPDQPWKPAWLGLDRAVPRAVPSDALTWAATQVLPGDLVQKAVLFGIVFFAGLGMVRLVGSDRFLPGAAAASLYAWNPFVYERLAIGHWALLCGYASLPWVAAGARDLRDRRSGTATALARLAVPLAIAAWTSPSGGVLASLVALLVVAVGGGKRRTVQVFVAALLLNAPWWLPGLLSAADQLRADPFGVTAFAARADTPWGVLGSLLTFGGMWKVNADPPGRDSLVLDGVSLALTGLGVLGAWCARRRDARLVAALGLAGALGLGLALVPTTAAGADLVGALVESVPGAGLLRDSQKWVALAALPVSAGSGWLADQVLDRFSDRHGRWWVGALVLLPVLALPALGWGLLGRLQPVTYPQEWYQVRSTMVSVGAAQGRTVVLPFQEYQRFGWNQDRAVLDPAPRFFPGDLVVDDALEVAGGTVGGESRRAARVRAALASARPATALRQVAAQEGIGWALVYKRVPWGAEVPRIRGRVVWDGPQVQLLALGRSPAGSGSSRVGSLSAAPVVAALVVAADVVALAAGLGAVGGVVLSRRRYSARRRPDDEPLRRSWEERG